MKRTIKSLFTAIIALSMLGIGTALADGSNLVPYAESFENWTLHEKVAGTNSWYGGVEDASSITNITYTAPACGTPLTGMHDKVLHLNTEGGILTNDFLDAIMATTNYVDVMVKFVLSETTPAACTTADSGIKLAVFANAESNLVVYHGMMTGTGYPDNDGQWSTNQVTVITNIMINPANWYRLTVAFDPTVSTFLNALEMFQVKIDGATITNDTAFEDGWKGDFMADGDLDNGPSANGTWFRSAMASGNDNSKKLRGVAFQGTGYIDDLVVTNGMPNFSAAPLTAFWCLIVTASGDSGDVVPGVGTYSVKVGDSTNVVATASDWYRIQSMTTNGTEVAAGVKTYNASIAPVAANQTNTVAVTFAQMTDGANGLGVPTAWLISLGLTEGFTQDDDPYGVSDEYLLNMNPTVSNAVSFAIDAITAAGGTVDVTVKLLVDTVAPPVTVHQSIYGTLKLYGRDSLTSGTWGTAVATTNVPPPGTLFNGSGKQTFHFTGLTATNTFYKATVE